MENYFATQTKLKNKSRKALIFNFVCTSTIEKEVWDKMLEYFSFVLLNKLCNLKAEEKNLN